MATNTNIPSQFVNVYYKNFVYDQNSLIKFYDENATIWRQTMTSPEGQSLSEAKELLAPEIQVGSEVRILSFQSCPLENGYTVNVLGSITYENDVKVLNQSFVLQMKYGRCFVISDILNINEVSNILPNTETTLIKNFKQSQKSKQNKKNDKFNHRPGRK